MRRLPLVVCALTLLACSGDEPEPAATASPGEPPSVTLDARGVPLFEGTEHALRFAIEPADGAARIIVNTYATAERALDPQRRAVPKVVISLCPLKALDEPIVLASCRTGVGNGVRESVTLPGMTAVAIVAQEAPGALLADVVIEYGEAGRDASILLPVLPGPVGGSCADNGCNPFFEMRPTKAGRFTATARWEGGEATLVLLQGNIVGRSQTATGIPYHEAALRSGPSPLTVQTRMSSPAEYALALRHQPLQAGQPALRNVRIDARWP